MADGGLDQGRERTCRDFAGRVQTTGATSLCSAHAAGNARCAALDTGAELATRIAD